MEALECGRKSNFSKHRKKPLKLTLNEFPARRKNRKDREYRKSRDPDAMR